MKELYDKLKEIALRDSEITEIELPKSMNTKEQWERDGFIVIHHENLITGEKTFIKEPDWEIKIQELLYEEYGDVGKNGRIIDFIRETREQAYQKGLDDGYSDGFRACEQGVTP